MTGTKLEECRTQLHGDELQLSRILVPVDFSDRCIGAAGYAKLLAARFGSEIIVIHVVEPPQYPVGPEQLAQTLEGPMLRHRETLAEEHLHDFVKQEFVDIPTRLLVYRGDPAATIVQRAHAEQAGLIVMPTHGYGVLRRAFVGSVTMKVLRDAECPVFTGVHLDGTGSIAVPEFHSVLCAVDLGPQSLQVLRWAGQFASSFGVELTATHAALKVSHSAGYVNPEAETRVSKQAGERVEALLGEAGIAGQILIAMDNDSAHVVCTFADRLHSSLMVIGRGSPSGASSRPRRHAYEIIRHSACPVVSV
jgi:nucleotide-binding universal stress UspA family protein